MKKILLLLAIVLSVSFFGCVSKSRYEKVKTELKEEKGNRVKMERDFKEKTIKKCDDEKAKLHVKIESLKTEISRIKSHNPPSTIEKSKSSVNYDYSKNNKPSSKSKSSVTNSSLAYKLAVVEKNGSVSGNDVLVKRFEYLLKVLDQKYVETNQQIADKTVKSRELLRGYGVEESLQNIMEGMNSLNDPKDFSKKYQEYIATYVIVRKEYSHFKTIKDLQSSIDLVGIDGLLRSSGIK